MKQIENQVVLLELVNQLREKGSWCGETHLQKTVFFLEELLAVPMDYDFVLYKHGPFSFELQDELILMRAYRLLELEPQPDGYGPKLSVSEIGKVLNAKYLSTIKEHLSAIEWISDRLSKKGVVDLERIGTALYVSREKEMSDKSNKEIIARIVDLKPHISRDQAELALNEVREMEKEFKTEFD